MLCQLLQVNPSLLDEGVVDIAPGHNTVLFQGKVLLRMMSDSTYRSAQRETIPLPHYSELWRQRTVYAASDASEGKIYTEALGPDEGRKPTAREVAAARLRSGRISRSANMAGSGFARPDSRAGARAAAAASAGDSSNERASGLSRRSMRGSSFRRGAA